MSNDPSNTQRRALLQAAAGIAIAQLAIEPALAGELPPIPEGKPGEFDFLSGQWKISHRRLKAPGAWDEFEGEATCWSILGGSASIEELRIPARSFAGMGIRTLDPKRKVWSDYWMNVREGVIGSPGTPGGFRDGVGIFQGEDTDGGKPIIVRGVWDRITKASCRWYQATSRDAGRTWEENWSMEWRRA